ncbi:MAG: hypothetical protein FGM24_11300 [Candidatus Kapabacteria bacterium]|nr:hypothetical protein [Candidatus Kapabacteria bacterium]
MSKVLFRVSYSIPDGKRPEYLAAVSKLQQHYRGTNIDYAVYETKGKHNHFQEVYVYPGIEAYEASDDPETLAGVSQYVDKIYALATNVSYDVSFEIV